MGKGPHASQCEQIGRQEVRNRVLARAGENQPSLACSMPGVVKQPFLGVSGAERPNPDEPCIGCRLSRCATSQDKTAKLSEQVGPFPEVGRPTAQDDWSVFRNAKFLSATCRRMFGRTWTRSRVLGSSP